jgi:hypothetical protein
MAWTKLYIEQFHALYSSLNIRGISRKMRFAEHMARRGDGRLIKHIVCGIVVSVADYKHRGPGFDSRTLLKIFLRELGLERGPLSLVIG